MLKEMCDTQELHLFWLQPVRLPGLQVLKEMCDKHKWEMPDYQFMAVAGGAAGQRAHICHLHLPDAGLLDVASPACSSQKSAKSAAASLALTLIQKNKDAAAASMTD